MFAVVVHNGCSGQNAGGDNVKEVFVPALGMAMEECVLVEWLKQPGDEVSKGDEVAIIETDKATMELESPAGGRLGHHLVEAGTTIPVGTTVSHVLEEGEDLDEAPTGDGAAAGADTKVAGGDAGKAGAASAADDDKADESGKTLSDAVPADHAPSADDAAASEYRTPHRLSPRQRRLQAQQGSAAPAAAATPATDNRHRAAVAEAVSESWRTMPHFGVTSHIWAEVLLSSVATAREKHPEVTATDLLLRAFAHALYEESASRDGSLGLAVATDRGVAIPVIADAGTVSLAELAAARQDAVARARAGKMAAVDGTTPAFTLSNLGGNDVEYFTGIIPVKQSGLLTVGRAKQRAVVSDGRLAAVTTMYATLNVDHRSFDGVHVAAVLDAFGRILNDAARLIGR